MSKKLYNPKSNAPAVYIPCWLIQISIQDLSHGAKICYGRLLQWSDSNGHAFRSCSQLAEEIGTSARSIEDYLKELRKVGLLGSYQTQAGGLNHYEFYEHPWMTAPIKDQLLYKSDPPQNPVVPPTESCGTPPQNPVDINKKEIERNNLSLMGEKIENILYTDFEQRRKALEFRKQCKEDKKCYELYEKLPEEIKKDKTFDDIHNECVSYFGSKQTPGLVAPPRFITWIKNEINYYKNQALNAGIKKTKQAKHDFDMNEMMPYGMPQ